MNKSKDQKTKKPEFNFNKEFVKVSNEFDDTNYVYDPVDNSINTEAEMKKNSQHRIIISCLSQWLISRKKKNLGK